MTLIFRGLIIQSLSNAETLRGRGARESTALRCSEYYHRNVSKLLPTGGRLQPYPAERHHRYGERDIGAECALIEK